MQPLGGWNDLHREVPSKKPRWKAQDPSWQGNHPFKKTEKQKPIVITNDKILNTYYGCVGHRISSTVYISTKKIGHFGTFEVPPGMYFSPADIHDGDEVYYIISGTLTQFNPETGEVHEVKEGEALWIPIGCWHQSHNFSCEQLKLLDVIAPYAWWPEEGVPPEYTGKPKVYGVESINSKKDQKSSTTYDSHRWQLQVSCGIDLLGEFPIQGSEGRKPPISMVRIPRDKMLRLIHGKDYRIPVTFYVSNDLLNMGEFTIFPRAWSEPESHKGEEAIYVLEGTLMVILPGSEETFKVEKTEGFFCPAGVEHQYWNATDKPVKAIFAIVPEL